MGGKQFKYWYIRLLFVSARLIFVNKCNVYFLLF